MVDVRDNKYEIYLQAIQCKDPEYAKHIQSVDLGVSSLDDARIITSALACI